MLRVHCATNKLIKQVTFWYPSIRRHGRPKTKWQLIDLHRTDHNEVELAYVTSKRHVEYATFCKIEIPNSKKTSIKFDRR